ncbi:MAG: hypothetical protein HYX23_00370 [Candidatus Zambryskibacteria bacterium]|nr:hypothetical protein [Candidatus Zambryskibacteria bacterium]
MNTPSNFKDLADIFIDLIRTALPVVAGFALLVFFWGLAKFIFRIGGDEKAVGEGKKLMIWGLVALFILLSLMGILAFLYRDFGFGRPFGPPLLPTYN